MDFANLVCKLQAGFFVFKALTRKIHKYAQSHLPIDSTRNTSSVTGNH